MMLQACLNLPHASPINRKGVLSSEKQLQEFTEKNLGVIFNYEFIQSECTIPNTGFRFDTLAYDSKTKGIKVLEYKNHKFDGLLEQGQSYLITLRKNFDYIESLVKTTKGISSINRSVSGIDLITPEVTARQQVAFFDSGDSIYKDLDLYLVEREREQLKFWKTTTQQDLDQILTNRGTLGKELGKAIQNRGTQQNNDLNRNLRIDGTQLTLEQFIGLSFTGTDEEIFNKIKNFLYFEEQLLKTNSDFSLAYGKSGMRFHVMVKYRGRTIGNINPFDFKDTLTFVWHIKDIRDEAIKLDTFRRIYMKGKDSNLRTNLNSLEDSNYLINNILKFILNF